MCQRNAVTEKNEVGKIELPPQIIVMSEADRRQEIDYRVAQKLGEREFLRSQYTRGIWDCLYVIFCIGLVVYFSYSLWEMEK